MHGQPILIRTIDLTDMLVNILCCFLEGLTSHIEEAAQQPKDFSAEVAALQADWIQRAQPMRSDATARALIGHLPSFPIITAAIAEEITGRSRVAAINGLEHLAQAGILTRHRNQRKGDSWEAKELFALLGGFESSVSLPVRL